MRRLTRSSAVLLVTAAAVTLGSTVAHADVTSGWRFTNPECVLLSVGGCNVTATASSSRVNADDGGCDGSVGVQAAKGSVVYSIVYAYTSATVTGTGMTNYRVWH